MLLTRTLYTPNYVLGTMVVGDLVLATIERPWIPNPKGPGGMPRNSCVPEGKYAVKPHDSEKFPGTYSLVNMQLGVYPQPGDIPEGQDFGRSAILIHTGNTVKDVIGCVAVGMQHSNDSVLRSREALGLLRAKLGRDFTHRLTIVKGEP